MVRKNKDFLSPRRDKKEKELLDFKTEDVHAITDAVADFSETDKYLNEKIDQANQVFAELEDKIEAIELKTQLKIDSDLADVKKQIEQSKSGVVETLALFAALFTFLSLQVQIFKDQKSVDQVIGLILITGGLITFFVLILDIMVKTKHDAENFLVVRFWLLLAMSILLIFSGVLVMKLGISIG